MATGRSEKERGGRADRRRAARPGRRVLPEPEDAAVEQPSARLHRRRHRPASGKCPYCGTEYRLKAGEKVHVASHLTRRERAMTRSLVIAPQWIGDAVMAEPLLAALAAARRAAHGRRAALGRAGVPRDAAGRRGRSSCRSRTAGSTGRRGAASRRRCAAASTSPTCCRTRSSRRCCRGSRASRGASATTAKAAALLLNRRLPNPPGRPPMVAFYGALAGAGFDEPPATRACTLDPAAASTARRTRPGCSAGATGPSRRAPNTARPSAGRPRTTRRWRASLHAADGAADRAARLGRGSARCAKRSPAQRRGACRVLAGRPRCSTRSR